MAAINLIARDSLHPQSVWIWYNYNAIVNVSPVVGANATHGPACDLAYGHSRRHG